MHKTLDQIYLIQQDFKQRRGPTVQRFCFGCLSCSYRKLEACILTNYRVRSNKQRVFKFLIFFFDGSRNTIGDSEASEFRLNGLFITNFAIQTNMNIYGIIIVYINSFTLQEILQKNYYRKQVQVSRTSLISEKPNGGQHESTKLVHPEV